MLVLVLAMLVVLSLVAGTVAAITSRLVAQSQQRAQYMQDEVDIASTRATILYLMMSQRVTVRGITVDNLVSFGEDGVREIQSPADLDSSLPIGNEIVPDGRVYRGMGNARFSLQDDHGLFGVNWSSPARLDRLLANGGRAQEPAETLLNRLLDYQDEDDLYRLNSAEADAYRKAGLARPTNRPLTTPMELTRVMGWKAALDFLSPAEINDAISVDTVSMVNVNTASARVLLTLAGMDQEKVDRVMAFRKLQPFLTDVSFNQFLGRMQAPEEPLTVYPAASGTLKLWSSSGGQVGLIHWKMTPIDEREGRPWREDYELIQSKGPNQDAPVYSVRSRLFAQQMDARN
ncbi:type II secretion system protein GspK [Thermomonas carbonis]|uniref:type II secretion system protein GspK n=1 Tax=Thermomonas carbonis TaxID=1463158 RepID=UPI001673E289|nr:type II secretion system protein GspK [Thermomonas carbonis]